MNNLKYIGIIPARYASTRFPGKPLADLGGKPVIQRVWEQVKMVLDDVLVATDDDRIAQVVTAFGGNAIMTSTHHRTGTDRCYEAYMKSESQHDVVINIQGDEPFIHPEQIKSIINCFDDAETDIATLIRPFSASKTFEQLENPNSAKVVVDAKMHAKYFSRSVIPFCRNIDKKEWPSHHNYFTHIGMYAYKSAVLEQITKLPQSALEIAESLEQLRWLGNGYTIKTAISELETIGIDTPDDLLKAIEELKQRNNG